MVHRLLYEFEIFHDFSELVGEVVFNLILGVVKHTVGNQQHQSHPLALVVIILTFDAGSVNEDGRRYFSILSIDQVRLEKKRKSLCWLIW